MKHKTTSYYFSVTIVVLLALFIVSLYVIMQAAQQPQELRQKATVPNGPATLFLTPNQSTIVLNSPVKIELAASIPSLTVDGFQIVASFSGTIPAPVRFTSATIPGLTTLKNQIISFPGYTLLKLAYISSDPIVPFQTNSIVSLGTIQFTPKIAGILNIRFDTTHTRILQNGTAKDLVSVPKSYTFTFARGYMSPTPTRFYSSPTPTRYYPTPTSTIRMSTPTPTRPYRTPTPTGIRPL